MNIRPKTREHHYAAFVEWTGASNGATVSYASYSRTYRVTFSGKAPLEGSADATFRGDPKLLNPEEMLLASLSTCHLLSYLAACALQGVHVSGYVDEAEGTMEETGGAGRFTRVVLRPHVTIASGDAEKALALHERAHADCFIAASVNFPVEVEARIERQGGLDV